MLRYKSEFYTWSFAFKANGMTVHCSAKAGEYSRTLRRIALEYPDAKMTLVEFNRTIVWTFNKK